MSKNQRKNTENQDPILQAFKETKESKEEQLGLFAEEEADVVIAKEEPTLVPEEKVQPEPEVVPEEKEKVQPKPEVVMYAGYDGVQYTEEEWVSPVVHNGPTRREVEGWKDRHEGHVYFTPFSNEVFVWRTLMRPEYREIIRDTSLTALDREEMFTEKCVLYPYDFSLEKIKKSRAGIASLLSEMIMDKSGFVAQSAPIKL